MKPIIYEDEHGAWDAVDVKNLIWEHGEQEVEIKKLTRNLKTAMTIIEKHTNNNDYSNFRENCKKLIND